MLSLRTERGIQFCDGLTRREFLRVGAVGLGGLTLPGLLRLEHAAAQGNTQHATRNTKAKSVIILFLSGGPSQLDMWDLKPNASQEIRGTFTPIKTNVPGIHISEHMPRMAKLADKYAIIRSMHHTDNGHPSAAYWMMIGNPLGRSGSLLSRQDRPHPGSALAKVLGANKSLPPFVMVPEMMPNQPDGPPRPGQHAGFLGAMYDPYLVHSDPNEPNYSPGDIKPIVKSSRLNVRRSLLDALNRQAWQMEQAADLSDSFYEKAFDMVSSPAAQKAFDISRESPRTRDRYGRHVFGQSVLLARRLVEAGVRLVHVNWVRHDNGKGGQGYDSHSDHLNWSKTELLPPTDAAFSSLIEDLNDRGLLDETLVIMMGEFGRTPKFNQNGGRDHWAQCFSLVVAGGGIRGGQIYGASDDIAAYPASDPVTPADLTATLYHCMGIDPETEIYDMQDRPFKLSERKPILGLL